MKACGRGHLDTVKLLLKNGANIEATAQASIIQSALQYEMSPIRLTVESLSR